MKPNHTNLSSETTHVTNASIQLLPTISNTRFINKVHSLTWSWQTCTFAELHNSSHPELSSQASAIADKPTHTKLLRSEASEEKGKKIHREKIHHEEAHIGPHVLKEFIYRFSLVQNIIFLNQQSMQCFFTQSNDISNFSTYIILSTIWSNKRVILKPWILRPKSSYTTKSSLCNPRARSLI